MSDLGNGDLTSGSSQQPAGMESALNAAIDRILNGVPTDEALIQLAEAGQLRLSFANVAREANCSRTLIGYDGCSYPEVRRRIIELTAETARRTSGEEIARLKSEVSRLEMEIAVRDTAYAELLIRLSESNHGRRPSGHPLHPQSLEERRAKLRIIGQAQNGGQKRGTG